MFFKSQGHSNNSYQPQPCSNRPIPLPCQELERVWVPVACEKCPAGYRMEQQLMLFPHRIMTYLFNECKVEIPAAEVDRFWSNAMAGGETYATEESRGRIPLGFYGDSAQLITKYRYEKMMCFFINIPIFRPKAVRYSRFLIWSCDNSLLYKNRTTNAVLRWVVWSLNFLYDGINPTCRPGNRPLSAGECQRAGQPVTNAHHKFQVVELRGDWEFHKFIWNYRCSWKGGVNMGICFRCPAMAKSPDDGLLYWNYHDNSTWSQRDFDTVDFITQRLPRSHICPLVILFHNPFRFFWTALFRMWGHKVTQHAKVPNTGMDQGLYFIGACCMLVLLVRSLMVR